jgi:signal transduction histidine kinase
MNGARVGRRHRLAIRIYLVSAAALVAVMLALYVLATTIWRPPQHGGPFVDTARYAASKIAARWTSGSSAEEGGAEEGVKDEVEEVRAQIHVAAAVYRWDGTLVASGTSPPLPPLESAERDDLAKSRMRDELARSQMIERGGTCTRERCQVAFAMSGQEGPLGYVVLESVDSHGRPPPFGVIPPALLLVGLGVAAALLGSSIARPLERLAQTAHALGAGDLKARTGLARRDELGTVARAFDEMAERVEKLILAQTELLANVAHELRTPLARIGVALDLAESGGDAVARESLAEIAEDLSELEQLVSDILASARMELATSSASSGAPPLHVAPLDVAQVVNSAAERLRHRHPSRTVEVELGPGLPSVEGDAVLLRRALDNLVDNARKYSRPGSVIRLRACRREPGVAIEVIDSGEGIPAEDLSRLFTPFFRGDKSRARATGGVGLGLSLARRIVEAHGGTLLAQSTLDVGTTMTVALPAPASVP